ncbi:MAG: septal ring lytic transglycosylase RlpA family protein [Sideroxydans sp.]|nr:septal ring lytic transglycosylase RlpA family protein [Sideroxydans sp.]
MNKNIVWVLCSIVMLGACSTAPQKAQTRQGAPAPIVDLRSGGYVPPPASAPTAAASGGYLAGDGPGADVPPDLDAIPDAVPKAEPLHRYANRPYSALGQTYTPLLVTGKYKERGIASWYGKKFHGQRTSIGEVYDMYAMTAAHPTLPIPSYARVTNPANGKSVVVRVNDRGPFLHDRIMDLSYVAAYKLGYVNNGSAEVEVESIAVDANAPVAAGVPTVKAEPVVAAPAIPVETADAPTGKVFLQLGAFKAKEGAESFLAKMRAEMGDSGKTLALYEKNGLTRVHFGPFTNADEARKEAAKLAEKLGFKPFVSLH